MRKSIFACSHLTGPHTKMSLFSHLDLLTGPHAKNTPSHPRIFFSHPLPFPSQHFKFDHPSLLSLFPSPPLLILFSSHLLSLSSSPPSGSRRRPAQGPQRCNRRRQQRRRGLPIGRCRPRDGQIRAAATIEELGF